MGDKTKIQWTDATWNAIRARHRVTGRVGWHCEKPSAGCKHCYAEALNKRFGTKLPFQAKHLQRGDVELFLDEQMLTQPLRWKRPRDIFPCSMTDIFGEFVPDEWIDKMFAVMALTPQHTYQPLTKRSARMREYFETWPMDSSRPDRITELACEIGHVTRGYRGSAGLTERPLPNVHLGVSAEDQDRADERIPDLLATPAAKRVVSYEPAIGPVDFTRIATEDGDCNALTADYYLVDDHGDRHLIDGPIECIDQIIIGGESGRGAREFRLPWASSVIDQCSGTDAKVFIKQLGSKPVNGEGRPVALRGSKGGDWDEWRPDLRVREMLEDETNG